MNVGSRQEQTSHRPDSADQDPAVKAAGAWINQFARTLKTCRLYDAINPTVGKFRQDLAIGMVFGVAFKFAMKMIVMPLLGADPINHAYHYLVGNRAALPGILFAVIVAAGFGEETLFRGYMFERLGKLWGRSVGAKILIVLLTAGLFGMAHYHDQGLPGAEQATISGLVFGTIFAVTGRIWMLMCAHAAFDLAAVAIIYWNLESKVAHLIFK